MIEKSLLDVSELVVGQLPQSGEKDINLALVLLIGKGKQVVGEVLTLHLGVALDEFDDLSRTNDLSAAFTFIVFNFQLVDL